MTNIRRVAQLISDLKTLRILTDENVLSCFDSTDESLTIFVRTSTYNDHTLAKYAFEQEFPKATVEEHLKTKFEDPHSLQITLPLM